jgi:hypothetical protein
MSYNPTTDARNAPIVIVEVSDLPYVIVRNQVADYALWKNGWDQGAALRRDGGVISEQLFRNPGEPNEVLLLLEYETMDQARRFATSDALRGALKESGIQDRVVYFPTSA